MPTFLGRTRRHVSAASGMPTGEHWAILTFGRITIPGDERSRQAPGHGYPEHDQATLTYEWFDEEAVFRDELAARYQRGEHARLNVVGIHVPETFGPSVEISVRKTEAHHAD